MPPAPGASTNKSTDGSNLAGPALFLGYRTLEPGRPIYGTDPPACGDWALPV